MGGKEEGEGEGERLCVSSAPLSLMKFGGVKAGEAISGGKPNTGAHRQVANTKWTSAVTARAHIDATGPCIINQRVQYSINGTIWHLRNKFTE